MTKQISLYRDVLIPGWEALMQMELRGIHYDVEASANLNERYVIPRLRELREELREISDRSLLNPNSSVQVKALLYDEWGLKHSLRGGRGKFDTSTGKEVRREIIDGRFSCKPKYQEKIVEFANRHEVFAKIDKQRGTYIEGLIKRVQDDGKLYTSFKYGTVTGRTSSTEPNLQNVTRSGAHGIPSMRTLFLPSPGNLLVQADLSQAELRTIAKLSGDSELLGVYRDSSRSLHRERAAAFYGPNYDKEEYTKSKNMNFGITYGQGAMAFAQLYYLPEKEAQAYIDDWWSAFPGILEWVNSISRKVETDGVIVSPFGHKRRFHLLTKENKEASFREAINFLPQNIAGVLTLMAVVELTELGIPLVVTVHDNIVADVPADEAKDVGKLMKETMENQCIKWLDWAPDDIPFVSDVSIGENWGDVKEVEYA